MAACWVMRASWPPPTMPTTGSPVIGSVTGLPFVGLSGDGHPSERPASEATSLSTGRTLQRFQALFHKSVVTVVFSVVWFSVGGMDAVGFDELPDGDPWWGDEGPHDTLVRSDPDYQLAAEQLLTEAEQAGPGSCAQHL